MVSGNDSPRCATTSLQCAAEACSDYIVTEDRDLLRLKEYAGIQIMNVADFIKIVAEGKR
jgi:predicted nucleic acid-binding protein